MHPEPIFRIFGQGVYLYGICFALGVIACFGFLMFTMWYKKFSETSSNAIIFIGIIATAFGALSGMIFQGIYDVIEGKEFSLNGMTFIGGLIGGVVSFLAIWNLYVFVIRPHTKIKALKGEMNAGLCDALPFIPIGIAIAHAFGRFGCFWGGCCYGIEVEWGLPCAANSTKNVMPTQLFEMSFLIILAVVMAVLYFKFKLNYNFAVYSIGYGIFRFIIEYYRADDRGELIGQISPSQFWGIVMVILGIVYIVVQYFYLAKLMKHPENSVEVEIIEADGEIVAAACQAVEALLKTEESGAVTPVEKTNKKSRKGKE